MGLCPGTVGLELHCTPLPLSPAYWHSSQIREEVASYPASAINEWKLNSTQKWNPQVVWQEAAPRRILFMRFCRSWAVNTCLSVWVGMEICPESLNASQVHWGFNKILSAWFGFVFAFFFFLWLCCLEGKHHVNFICLCCGGSPSFQTRLVFFPLTCWSGETKS